MKNWKPGDMVMIVGCPWWHYCGSTAMLVERSGKHLNSWVLDLPPKPPYKVTICGEEFFRPIPDDHDTFERFHKDLVPADSDYEWRNPTKVTVTVS